MERARRSALAATAAMLLAAWQGDGRAQDPATAIGIPAGADLLDYDWTSGGRMTVPVTIDGAGPYQFLVDTGSERTLISTELAGLLQLRAGPTARVHHLTGRSDIATVVIPTLELSRRKVRSIEAPALARADIGAHGMLGIDSLKSQHIVFDFAARKMALTPLKPADRKWSDEIVVTARTRLGRLALTNAVAHDFRIVVILDTGAEVSMGNEALRRKLARRQRLRETVPVRLESVTGDAMTADYSSIGRVVIGGLRLTNMSVAFGDVRLFDELDLRDRPAILLGMDVLSRFERVSVDFDNREVRFLLPQASAPAPASP